MSGTQSIKVSCIAGSSSLKVKSQRRWVCLVAMLAMAGSAYGQLSTVVTTDAQTLRAALKPAGLAIASIVIRNGMPGQIGTYSNFNLAPVSISDGIVLSSGDVTSLGPLPEVLDPAYDPASPPAVVSSQMAPDPDSGSTAEFDAFGNTPGNIENFSGSFDVAAVEVHFTLSADAQIKFDFIFGTVEYPIYTSSFTDAFLVFLDGTAPADQITHDALNRPVQVGASFAGLETTADHNTAFAALHAVIHHLTTTSALLTAGEHVLIFEVGDVNDHVLDSAVFLANLRTGIGNEGTEPTNDERRCSIADVAGGGPNGLRFDGILDGADFIAFINSFAVGDESIDSLADIAGGGPDGLDSDGIVDGTDFIVFINAFSAGC